MNEQYRIVRVGGSIYTVTGINSNLQGLEYRPYGDKNECLARAEKLATRHARKGSGGRKGHKTVVRSGNIFCVVKVEGAP